MIDSRQRLPLRNLPMLLLPYDGNIPWILVKTAFHDHCPSTEWSEPAPDHLQVQVI